MRRAIETDFDYKHWFGDYNIDRPTTEPRQLIFKNEVSRYTTIEQVLKKYTTLHTTSPKKYWAKSSLNPKVQLKDSAVINEIWDNFGRFRLDKEIKTCADWLHYISGISSASSCVQDGRANDDSVSEIATVEKIKIIVNSDENDFGGDYPYFKRSLLSFMVLHNDGRNVILAPLLYGTTKFPFERNTEELNYPDAEDLFVSKLCSSKSKNYGWVNELFVVNIDCIRGQPENSGEYRMFDDDLKFGDFIHSSWDFNTNEKGITEIGEAILGDNLVYDLIPKTELYVGGNLIEKMLSLTNDNYNKYAMLDLMNELTHQAERVIDTHTVSTTTKVKTSKTTFIPTWKDNRPSEIIDLTDGEYVMYSDVFRCPVCNVKVKVIGKGSNRKSQAECPLCKKGKIEFPHLVNEEGVEEE